MPIYDINNKQVQLCIVLKLQSIQMERFPNLTYHDLENYITKTIWRYESPHSLHEAVNDILSLSADQIVRFLAKQAVIEGQFRTFDDFSDLLGGKNYE